YEQTQHYEYRDRLGPPGVATRGLEEAAARVRSYGRRHCREPRSAVVCLPPTESVERKCGRFIAYAMASPGHSTRPGHLACPMACRNPGQRFIHYWSDMRGTATRTQPFTLEERDVDSEAPAHRGRP